MTSMERLLQTVLYLMTCSHNQLHSNSACEAEHYDWVLLYQRCFASDAYG